MEKPLITVIIPVYNVEKYIEKCIFSVINQTYSNIEIILVDDGATDKSGIICDEFQKKDERIKVIHKKNGGLSDARNVALDQVRSELVTFIDSDDYVSNDYIEYMYKLMKKNDADITICQLKKIYSESEKLDEKKECIEIFDSVSAIRHYLYQRKFTASAPCKLYKTKLFSDIRYPVGYYYEDMAIICKLLDGSKKIVVSNQQKYYYIQRVESIMGQEFNFKKMHRVEVSENIQKFICERYPELIDASNARCFLAAVQTFREVPNLKKYKHESDLLWAIICKYRINVLGDKSAKKITRIIAMFSFGGKEILQLWGQLYSKIRHFN